MCFTVLVLRFVLLTNADHSKCILFQVLVINSRYCFVRHISHILMQSLLAYTNDTNLFLLRKSSWHKVEGRGMNKYEIHEKYGTVGFPETF